AWRPNGNLVRNNLTRRRSAGYGFGLRFVGIARYGPAQRNYAFVAILTDTDVAQPGLLQALLDAVFHVRRFGLLLIAACNDQQSRRCKSQSGRSKRFEETHVFLRCFSKGRKSVRKSLAITQSVEGATGCGYKAGSVRNRRKKCRFAETRV